MRTPILIIFIVLVCSACQRDDAFISTQSPIQSRGIEIPATFVHPESADGPGIPLVVMVHGHGGTRDEAGAYVSVADALAEQGIASIRVDFPGCGESEEPFTENVLTNMLADIRSSREFAVGHPRIDIDRVGILGFSMGGRLAILATAEDEYAAVVTWAPAVGDGMGSMLEYIGGQSAYERLRAEADAAGFAVFETPWGTTQHLSLKWFTDLEDSKPQSVISEYEGALLVVHGSDDQAIHPKYGKAVVASATRSHPLAEYIVQGADHGLGFFDGNTEMAADVVSRTAQFLKDNL